MPQWLITAHDGDDAEAPARRQAARPEHLACIGPMVERGEVLLGGAILDEAGTMIGSSMVVEFPDRAALDAWLGSDPYVKRGVWRRVEVQPFRVAVTATAKPAG